MIWPLFLIMAFAILSLVGGLKKGNVDLLVVSFGWWCVFAGYGFALFVLYIVGSS